MLAFLDFALISMGRATFLLLPLWLLTLACAGAPTPVARAEGAAASAGVASPSPAATVVTGAARELDVGDGDGAGADADTGASATPASATPEVKLDSLLKLPAGRTYTVERRGGLSSGEWKARFSEANAAIEAAQAELLKTEEKLETSAQTSAAWQVAPPLPGASASNPNENTVDFQLRQELKRHRDEIDRLERRLRDVVVEANLHGVPEEWR